MITHKTEATPTETTHIQKQENLNSKTKPARHSTKEEEEGKKDETTICSFSFFPLSILIRITNNKNFCVISYGFTMVNELFVYK